MEIAPGVYQFKVPIPNNPLENLLSYLVASDDGYVMIDTGWNSPEAMSSVIPQLHNLGLDFKDISTIILTHIHPDHSGLAARFKELSGARLIMHQEDAPSALGGRPGFGPNFLGMLPWLENHGMPREEIDKLRLGHSTNPGTFLALEPDMVVQGGETITSGSLALEVIWTPGHSPGHICLYNRAQKILFSGDHVLPVITPHVSLHHQSHGDPLEEYVSSLAAVQDLEVELVLPAHEFAFANLRERVANILHHHQARLEAVLQAMGSGWKAAYEIAAKVPWDIGPWENIKPWDRRAALAETLAHLEHLYRRGKIERAQRDGLTLWAVSA
ncbi:MAG: MBL fold metallo-hydrolase [Chloroflexi bacterium]|nr:MBL fold metallo-hydrolase [Chloroflexota bacterium]